MDDQQPQLADTLVDADEPKSSDVILTAIREAAGSFEPWYSQCEKIDKLYSLARAIGGLASYDDPEFDLLWSSTEILKPAVYARPPVPAVSTRFSIRDPFLDQVSEMLERALTTTLDKSCIDQVMIGVRDDLILAGRGVSWLTYEDAEHQRVVIEHLEPRDFLHEAARKWAEVGWVARCAWMTADEMRDRFHAASGDSYKSASFAARDDKHGMSDTSAKAPVWEVWSKTDNRVYWVVDGVDVLLDDAEPFLNLEHFYPCPRPAYGTLKRKSLVPVPDYARYESTLEQINDLTSRIYGLLDQVRVRGLIPTGGDVGSAVEALLTETDDDTMLIPVPAGAFVGTGEPVTWLPLEMFANTITGLISARQQLISDFYELSGISDIMRGASDAQETLGAQQLKSQYGSVRIREKVDALVQHAQGICAIAGEIICENFDGKTLLEMSLTKMPTDADIKKQITLVQKQEREAVEHLNGQLQALQQQAAMQLHPPQPGAPQPQGVPAQ